MNGGPDMGWKRTANATADTAIVTTAETVAVSITNINLPGPGRRVAIRAWAQVTTGTNTTALTPRIRRGTTASDTLVGEANAEQIETAAGNTEGLEVQVTDTPGELAGGAYCLTVEQTAASANGSILQAGIEVELLD